MKLAAKSSLLALITLFANLLYGQINGVDLNVIEATTPLSPDEVPATGTFYSAQNPSAPPLPGNIFGWSCWPLGGGAFLMDDLGGSFAGGFSMMSAMDDSVPIPGESEDGDDGEEFTNNFSFTFPTNGLWLWITNISDGTVYANMNGATDYVYEIFSTTNLAIGPAVTNWNIETEIFPGANTNVMPFNVSMNGRNPLFLWARDWTGITSNGNLTPDWWLYYWFGTINLADSDLDSQGNTLYYDYQNGIDPNIIQFSISVTNNYVAASSVPVQLNVSAGTPYYFAVVVDDTNYLADATWQAYTSSNILVNLGAAQNWHSVWIGLQGFSTNGLATWNWARLDLTPPPSLVITNPASFNVNEPVIQIYGYCQESLTGISYDISNATGIFTNQLSEITDQYFDTNTFSISTNYFECLDVPLTNGVNTITIHATDLAGETTVTNFDFTLDYSSKTNPPALQIFWPQSGTQISGTNFTCNGWINDPTASVIASFVYTNGDTNAFPNGLYTNFYSGDVGRDGSFTIENLPLNSGSNMFSVVVADVVGNMSATNISVVQTNFVLAINPVSPASQLWQPTATVTGTISDSSYAVWINGVKGTNYGNGTWSANNVPVSNAVFTATAYAPNEQQPDGSYGN